MRLAHNDAAAFRLSEARRIVFHRWCWAV